MTRSGRDKTRDDPERRCISTGAVGPKQGLIRFVVGPGGDIVPDIAGKLPGRGIWVTADRAALDKAVAKGLFARAARRAVEVPGDLVALTEAALVRRVIGLISLARKAGDAVAGYEKVKDWLEKGRAAVLIQARDGSERGKAKLWPPEPDESGQDVFVGCLSAQEIGLAFGREHAIHAALAAGGLSTRVVEDAARLAGVRGQDGGAAAGKD